MHATTCGTWGEGAESRGDVREYGNDCSDKTRTTNDCCLAATLCAFLKLSRYIVVALVIVVVVAASGLLIV